MKKMTATKPKVVIAYTSRGNDLYYQLPRYILHQERIFGGIGVVVGVSLWGPATEKLFSDVARAEWDFMHILDSDVCPDDNTTNVLVSNDLDICASPVFMYDPGTNDVHLNMVRALGTNEREYAPGKGIEKMFASSFASVVIKKRVFDAFMMAGEKFCSTSPLIEDFPNHETFAPDTVFYCKAARLGFEAFMDWTVPFGTHHKLCYFNSPFVVTLAERFGVPGTATRAFANQQA
jgi:hypothetical protein